jgi:phosphoglycolate phosphatase
LIKAVLFDLDGTLLDSAPDLVASLNFLRAAEGLDALPLASLRPSVSRGAAGLIREGMPPCDDATFAAWRDTLVAHYARNSFVHTRPFDGVSDVLEGLACLGVPWGIVTNKHEYLCRPILDATGWWDTLGALICGDTVEHAKPHPEPVLAACARIGVTPDQALMVGDDPRDIEAGHRAGSRTALAAYGYAAHQVDAGMPGAGVTIDTPIDVLDLVRQSRATP